MPTLCYLIQEYRVRLRNPQHRPPVNLIPLQSGSNLVNLLKLKDLILRAHSPIHRHLQQSLHLILCSHRAAQNVVSAVDTVERRDGDMVVWAWEADADKGSGRAEKLEALLVGLFEANNDDDSMGADAVGHRADAFLGLHFVSVVLLAKQGAMYVVSKVDKGSCTGAHADISLGFAVDGDNPVSQFLSNLHSSANGQICTAKDQR